MPPENESIESWSGATKEEIVLLIGVVAVVILLTLVIQALRRWLARRREMRSFFSIVDGRHLNENEEEAVRQLVASANVPRPSEILTSIATFDSLAEAALREAIRAPGRESLRTQMESLYSARAKLFPQEPLHQRVRSPESQGTKAQGASTSSPKVSPQA
jgi:hypothetical protein